jgi:hypothetical protein
MVKVLEKAPNGLVLDESPCWNGTGLAVAGFVARKIPYINLHIQYVCNIDLMSIYMPI